MPKGALLKPLCTRQTGTANGAPKAQCTLPQSKPTVRNSVCVGSGLKALGRPGEIGYADNGQKSAGVPRAPLQVDDCITRMEGSADCAESQAQGKGKGRDR